MIVLALIIPEISLCMLIEFECNVTLAACFLQWDLPVLLHSCRAPRVVLGWLAAHPFTQAFQDALLPPDRWIGMGNMAYNELNALIQLLSFKLSMEVYLVFPFAQHLPMLPVMHNTPMMECCGWVFWAPVSSGSSDCAEVVGNWWPNGYLKCCHRVVIQQGQEKVNWGGKVGMKEGTISPSPAFTLCICIPHSSCVVYTLFCFVLFLFFIYIVFIHTN